MYKLIAIDLDDTLLNENNEISKGNLEALNYAKCKGIKIVICTGRTTKSVEKYTYQIDGYNEEDYIIVFNGAVITSNTGRIIFRKTINKDLLDQLIDIGRNENVAIQIYDDHQFYVEGYTQEVEDYEKNIGLKSVSIKDLKEKEMTIKLLYNSNNISKLLKIKETIANELGNKVFAFFSKPNYLEVLTNEANKGLAVEFLASHLKINKEETIAIGDSENDIYMIQYAGIGVCMKNGRDAVKKTADYITKNNNNEDGVAEVIYKFI